MHGTIPEEDPSNLNLIVCGDFNGGQSMVEEAKVVEHAIT